MAHSRSSFWATLFLFAAVCCFLLPTQVLSSSVDLATTGVFESSMDPTQEVPPASLSAHTGSAKLLYTFSSRYLSWVIEHTVWDSTGAHIHGPAAPGENADVVIDLGNPESPITGGTSLSEEQEKTLLEGLFYIDVHSPSYPDGDIRGQIVRSKSKYNADLSGSQMVPPVTSNATGTATFTYDHTAQVLSFTITHNLTTARTAFLHGPAEKGKVANATTFRFPRANSPITGTFAFNTTDEVILFQNLFYVNITSEANPYGELRGQVTLTEEDDEGFSKKMSWWKIILVIIGVGAGVALLVAGGVFSYRVWKKKKDYKDQQKQFADPLLKA